VTKTLSQNYPRQDLFQNSLTLKALAFRDVCVELIVGQIQSQGQKLSQRQVHLQNLRGRPDGFSWLVKNRAYFGSLQNTQLLEVFFARTELLAQLSSILPSSSAKKESELKLGSSSVTVRDFCSRRIRARSSRTVSSSAHWKLVSYGQHRQLCLFS